MENKQAAISMVKILLSQLEKGEVSIRGICHEYGTKRNYDNPDVWVEYQHDGYRRLTIEYEVGKGGESDDKR